MLIVKVPASDDRSRGSGLVGIEHVQVAIEAALTAVPGVGPVVRHLIEVMPAVQAHRAEQMLSQVLTLIDVRPDAFVNLLEAQPRLRRLVWEAAAAAAESELDHKIKALAAIVVEAVRDDAAIDPAQIRIRALRELEALHIRALVAIAGGRPDDDRDKGVSLVDALGLESGLATAITADLMRLALVASAGMSFSNIFNGGRIAPFGQEILEYLEAAADI